MKYAIFVFVTLLVLSSCSKELSQEGPVPVIPVIPPDTTPVKPPVEPEPQIKFQLKAFYADVAIDFDETDGVVKEETDLWAYVQDYIKDDINIFLEDGTLEVLQNAKKMPGLSDEILYRKYQYGSDGGGEYMKFLSANYEQVKYRLYERTDDHFIIGVKWKDGAHVYSRFERVP